MCVYLLDGIVPMLSVWMTQSFVSWWKGRNSSTVSPLADIPASCPIVLWFKTGILHDWKCLFTVLSIFISDVPQDTMATHCLDRDVWLAGMKSMVHTVLWFKSIPDFVYSSRLSCTKCLKIIVLILFVYFLCCPVIGNCYNCDQRGSDGCHGGGVCRCKVTKRRQSLSVDYNKLIALCLIYSMVRCRWTSKAQVVLTASLGASISAGTTRMAVCPVSVWA